MSTRVKKWINVYSVFMLVWFWVLCILKMCLPKGDVIEKVLISVVAVYSVLVIISFILGICICVICYFKRSIDNIHSCGDDLFIELDYYHERWGETKEHYYSMIDAIHFYYKEGGKVDRVVGKDLKRLYNRLEFLERGVKTREYVITCVSSVVLSICATVVFENVAGVLVDRMWPILVFAILFWGVVLFRESDLFIDGSNPIKIYEIKLLKEKIADVENDILIDIEREDILLTKQNILKELINKAFWKVGKKCEAIVEDIHSVEKLNLNIQDTSNVQELLFQIGKNNKEIILFMDENGNWVNEQYKQLYEILRKYNLICKVKSVEEK